MKTFVALLGCLALLVTGDRFDLSKKVWTESSEIELAKELANFLLPGVKRHTAYPEDFMELMNVRNVMEEVDSDIIFKLDMVKL